MMPELRDLSYEECLKEYGLTTLQERRSNIRYFFKILNGYKNIDRTIFVHLRKIIELDYRK